MAEWFTTDGKIDPDQFESWQDLENFRAAEDAAWAALEGDDLSNGASAVINKVRAQLEKLRTVLHSFRNSGQNFGAGLTRIQALLDQPNGAGLPSSVLGGDLFHDLHTSSSLSAALFKVGFDRGLVSLADARDKEDLIGALWDINPGLLRTAELSDVLSKERDSFRRVLRSELDRLKKNDAARLDEWEAKLVEAKSSYVGWARRRSTRWGHLTRSWEERHRLSETRIRSVEETYKEQMGLKAPVKYWADKATQHKKSEVWARIWVLAFFVITLPAMASAFAWTGWVLIDQALQVRPTGAPPFPTAIFIIASAGLASCAGLVFWAGRLLTKLYLSQHHLRQDAEERATMTETYLALIENSAASTEDRQVILNALFRNTPDGIVKEEGGMDPSLAAALGKFLSR